MLINGDEFSVDVTDDVPFNVDAIKRIVEWANDNPCPYKKGSIFRRRYFSYLSGMVNTVLGHHVAFSITDGHTEMKWYR